MSLESLKFLIKGESSLANDLHMRLVIRVKIISPIPNYQSPIIQPNRDDDCLNAGNIRASTLFTQHPVN